MVFLEDALGAITTGTNQVTGEIRYDTQAMTNAIRIWSVTGSAASTTSVSYQDAFAGQVILNANSGNTQVTGSNLLFDTDFTLGAPMRVAATFTTNNAATTNLTTTANTFLVTNHAISTIDAITSNTYTLTEVFTSGGATIYVGENMLNATHFGAGLTVLTQRELTDEEKVEQARLRAEYEERRRIEDEMSRVASGKAEHLLRRVLSKAQNAELDEKGYFHLVGRDGHTYRIGRGWSHNVKRVDPITGAVKMSFCIHPRMQVPVADNMLAQKLLLEADPERFLTTAYQAPPAPVGGEGLNIVNGNNFVIQAAQT